MAPTGSVQNNASAPPLAQSVKVVLFFTHPVRAGFGIPYDCGPHTSAYRPPGGVESADQGSRDRPGNSVVRVGEDRKGPFSNHNTLTLIHRDNPNPHPHRKIKTQILGQPNLETKGKNNNFRARFETYSKPRFVAS